MIPLAMLIAARLVPHVPRDVVLGFEWCASSGLAFIGYWLVRWAAHHFPRVAPAMWWVGAVFFLGAAACGYTAVWPKDPGESMSVLLFALLCGFAAANATAVVGVPLLSLKDGWEAHLKAVRDAQDHARRQRDQVASDQADADRQLQLRLAELAAEANRPPPPPPLSAKEKYEQRLRVLESSGLQGIELTAAQQRAHQQFLRDLEGDLA